VDEGELQEKSKRLRMSNLVLEIRWKLEAERSNIKDL
jgi:hypothetical protein